ncbi:Hypothetical protein NTJ_09681 [Nesidiocoris tenuis]|uniref:Cytochrome b-c1 complex subunit Rieske, mitochondrial n=1 Tax=Nesidiocoris tenuis TaxID=355587 RepID=A0ABN7AXH6_9HEMI|nr:Hypothetical protein NTJ_09681 [Nesidiocoris tenuis]
MAISRNSFRNCMLVFNRDILKCKRSTSCLQSMDMCTCRNEDGDQDNPKNKSSKRVRTYRDLEWPDFSKYRRGSNKYECIPASENSSTRKLSSYIPIAATLIGSVYGAKTVVTQFITSMSPSKDVLAMAQAEVNISNIPVGMMTTVKWRGKPLFIKHRAEADVQTERQTPLSMLRDPERDEDRVLKPEWLVVIGVCTHLGCVPISNAGDYNAFYCPCHGSHYDHSGRIRKGPAPTNLEVPPYIFLNDDIILVG